MTERDRSSDVRNSELTLDGSGPSAPNAGLARAGLITVGASLVGLVFNLVTGVLIARSLGAEGRGEYAALLTIPAVGVWVFSMGVQSAASFHVALHPDEAGRLIASWLLMGVGLIGGGMLVLGALAPMLLSAQDEHLVTLLRFALLSMLPGFVFQLFSGVLAGAEDYTFVNILQFLSLGVLAAAFIVIELVAGLTVITALVTTILAYLLTSILAGVRVLRVHGVTRPDLHLARKSLWYGFRVHGNAAGGQVTTRLDLFIMPSLIGASGIGQYAVATNVSTIVVSIASYVPIIVLPAAARRGRQGSRVVVMSACAVLAMSVAAALIIAIGAGVGVRLIYGDDFGDSVLPLRLLLAGTVAYATAQVLAAGIASVDRPFTAGLAQLPAVVVTVAGLTLFLRDGGIEAAAIVSSVAYITYLVTALLLYRRVACLEWRELVPSADEIQRLRTPWWPRR